MRRFALLVTILLPVSVGAHDPAHDQASCRPSTAPSHAELVMLYTSLAELPIEEQRQQMWALSSDAKAALWTYNIKRYLGDYPAVGVEVTKHLGEGIAMINTPAWFDIQEGSFGFLAKSQALAEFKRALDGKLAPAAIYELFVRLGPEPEASLPELPTSPSAQGRFSLQPNFFHKCTCATWFDCGSRTDRDCFDAYCSYTKTHCGWFNDEPCTGVCKSTEPTSP